MMMMIMFIIFFWRIDIIMYIVNLTSKSLSLSVLNIENLMSEVNMKNVTLIY